MVLVVVGYDSTMVLVLVVLEVIETVVLVKLVEELVFPLVNVEVLVEVKATETTVQIWWVYDDPFYILGLIQVLRMNNRLLDYLSSPEPQAKVIT